jgi:serine/threonine protein kinase
MEYAANGSLEHFLSRVSTTYLPHLESKDISHEEKLINKELLYPLTGDRVLRWALDIASGLNYLNSRKMPHRDVKPQNIVLDRNNNIKICDLGFKHMKNSNDLDSRSKSDNNDERRIGYNIGRNKRLRTATASSGEIFEERGTTEYKPPEAFATLYELWGEKIDVWSYGVLLKRMCSLRQPFDGSLSRREILLRLANVELMPFTYLNNELIHYAHPKLENLSSLCMDVDPTKRPHFEEIVGILNGLRKELKKQGGTINTHRSGRKKNKKRKMAIWTGRLTTKNKTKASEKKRSESWADLFQNVFDSGSRSNKTRKDSDLELAFRKK